MIRKTLVTFLAIVAVLLGLSLTLPAVAGASPVANTAEGTTPVHPVVNRGYQGTGAQTVSRYGVTSGTLYTDTTCYRVQFGNEAMNAALEVLRTGNFLGTMTGQLGMEDSELDVALLWLHDKLAHGTVAERGAYGAAAVDALPVCDSSHGSVRGPAATVPVATYTDAAHTALHSMPTLTEHNSQTNAVRVQTQCFLTREGAGAIAAESELIRTGVYDGGSAFYLGGSDSELVLIGQWLHNKLAGGLPAGRGAMSVGTAVC